MKTTTRSGRVLGPIILILAVGIVGSLLVLLAVNQDLRDRLFGAEGGEVQGLLGTGEPQPRSDLPEYDEAEGEFLIARLPRSLAAGTMIVPELLSINPTDPNYRKLYGVLDRDNFAEGDVVPIALNELPQRAYGLVLKRDKRAGTAFTDLDFHPRGTRAGVASGIPAGKRGITIDPQTIEGARALRRNDRFDLLTVVDLAALDGLGGRRSDIETVFGAANAGALAGDTTSVQVLIANGAVVEPYTVNEVEGDRVGRMENAHEWTIAVEVEEIPGLTEALARGQRIFVAARSGLAGAEENDKEIGAIYLQDSGDGPRFVAVEQVIGTESTLKVFPTRQDMEEDTN